MGFGGWNAQNGKKVKDMSFQGEAVRPAEDLTFAQESVPATVGMPILRIKHGFCPQGA